MKTILLNKGVLDMRGLMRLLLLGVALGLAGSVNSLSAQVKAAGKAPEKAPAVIILKGAPLGGVKFTHAAHEKMTKCVECHHACKPEKALASAHQQCGDCHTKVAAPPMKTTMRDAFHNATGKTGTCIDCHAQAVAAGKTAVPVKCNGCHKKENVAL
jgi:hypothetical protein